MQHVYTIINQIVILSLIGIIGFIAGRKKYLPENTGYIISRIIVKLTAPLLVFTTLSKYSFTPKLLMDGTLIYFLGIVFLIMSYLFGIGASRLLKLEGATANVFKMNCVFGNVVFLAYPLIDAMYPEKGLMYAVFYSLANDTVLWTLGIYLVNSHNTTNWKGNLKHLINANTIAFAVGIICMLGNLQHFVQKYSLVERVYNLVYDSLNPLGKTTIYLSMLFIGLILSEVRFNSFKDILGRRPLFLMTVIKLLVIPGAALVILNLFGNLIDPFIKTMMVLQLAMPCGTIAAALAAQYESDYRFASEGVFFSTIAGVFTLPVIVYLLQYL